MSASAYCASTIPLQIARSVASISPVRLKPQPLGSIVIHVVAPPSLHDRIFVWVHDVEMNKTEGERKIYLDARTSDLDQESVARFMEMPYGLYDVEVHLTGEDTSKPSWTHDKVQIGLLADSADITITLRKNN